jgi:Protein of unknown function (DUF3311)
VGYRNRGARELSPGAIEEEIYVTHEPSNAERGDRPVPPQRAGTTPGWYLLLVLPLIGTLIPPIYNSEDPTLIGIPFFYWYLLLWVPISVVCTVIFYRATREDR